MEQTFHIIIPSLLMTQLNSLNYVYPHPAFPICYKETKLWFTCKSSFTSSLQISSSSFRFNSNPHLHRRWLLAHFYQEVQSIHIMTVAM